MFNRELEIRKTEERIHILSNLPSSEIEKQMLAGKSSLAKIEEKIITQTDLGTKKSTYRLVELLIAKGEIMLDLMDLDIVRIIGARPS